MLLRQDLYVTQVGFDIRLSCLIAEITDAHHYTSLSALI